MIVRASNKFFFGLGESWSIDETGQIWGFFYFKSFILETYKCEGRVNKDFVIEFKFYPMTDAKIGPGTLGLLGVKCDSFIRFLNPNQNVI